jgi:hypothetical protein
VCVSSERKTLVQLLALYEQLHPNDPPLSMDEHLEALWGQIIADPKLHYLVGELDGKLVSSWRAVVMQT